MKWKNNHSLSWGYWMTVILWNNSERNGNLKVDDKKKNPSSSAIRQCVRKTKQNSQQTKKKKNNQSENCLQTEEFPLNVSWKWITHFMDSKKQLNSDCHEQNFLSCVLFKASNRFEKREFFVKSKICWQMKNAIIHVVAKMVASKWNI